MSGELVNGNTIQVNLPLGKRETMNHLVAKEVH